MVHKTIVLTQELKTRLDALKVHKRDTYGDIIENLINEHNLKTNQ